MKVKINSILSKAADSEAAMNEVRTEARNLVGTAIRTTGGVAWLPDEFWKKRIDDGEEKARIKALVEDDIVVTFEQDEKPVSRGFVVSVNENEEDGEDVVTVVDIYSEEERTVALEDVLNPEELLRFILKYGLGEN